MTSGIRSEVPPSNGTPSRVPAKPMTAQSPSFAARSSTAARVAFWSRSSSMTLSTLASSIVLDLGREVEAPVVAELDLGAHLDRRLEPEGLALLGLHDLDVRVRERDDPLLDDRPRGTRPGSGARRPRRRPPWGRGRARGWAAGPCRAGTRRRACGATGGRWRRGWRGRSARRGPRSRGGSSSSERGWRSHSSDGEYRVGRRCVAAGVGGPRRSRLGRGRVAKWQTRRP